MAEGPSLSSRVTALKPSPTLAIDAKAKALRAQGVDIVNLAAGEPDFDTPEHIKKAAEEALRAGFTKYTAVAGIPELREAVAQRIKRDYGIEYRPEEVLVSTGGKQALYNALQAIVDPGDEVIIPSPYWVSYPPMVELAGGRPVFVKAGPETDFVPGLEEIERAIGPRTKAVIVNSPSNPTGAVWPEDLLSGLARLALGKGIFILSDDIYDLLRYDGRPCANPASLVPEAKDLVIIASGVSKAYSMTGWRIGYLLGPERVVKAASKIQSQSTSNPNSIAQKAALAALTGPQECVEEMREAFKRRRDLMVDGLRAVEGLICPEPQGAFYVFPDVSSYYGKRAGTRFIDGSLALADWLLEEARLAVVPGIAFGEDRAVRLSYAAGEETLKKGLDRLAEALSKLT